MQIKEFGVGLLTTGDLDPIYIALNKCNFDWKTRNRWLTAYCAFYSAGFACYAAGKSAEDYWSILHTAAANQTPTPFGERWPRASERRHFRGGQATKGIADWSIKHPNPEKMFLNIACQAPSFCKVSDYAKTYRSVGSWLSFKIVDLVDACTGVDIDQSDVMLFMYDAPRISLLNRWREKFELPNTARPKDEAFVIKEMIKFYQEMFKDYECPHKPGKPVDMFCLETIFCKYQSHLNGHYPPNKDIKEIRHGLEPWLPYSENAKLFLENMPLCMT